MKKSDLDAMANKKKAINNQIKEKRERLKEKICLMDSFQQSTSSCSYDPPLSICKEITTARCTPDFKVSHAVRNGIAFNVVYINHLGAQKTFRNGRVHTSAYSLVKLFGLSQEAKKLYADLGIYDTTISGQANLTTKKWQQQVSEPIRLLSDTDLDVIFSGCKIFSTQSKNKKLSVFFNKSNHIHSLLCQVETTYAELERKIFSYGLYGSSKELLMAHQNLNAAHTKKLDAWMASNK